jgi:hypothetical protein
VLPKNFSDSVLQAARPKKVRTCLLCHDTGSILVWKRDKSGKLYSVVEVCACVNWGK